MARVTVYVPDELFDRMKAVRTTAGPNWSQIASDAFERALKRLQKARSRLTTAAHLPYPTQGDYDVWEVKHSRGRFQVKVSDTVMSSRWRKPLSRVVARFAQEFLDANPEIEPGDVLPKVVTSPVVEDVISRM
ncbi:MAG: hypothetical protein KDC98_18810 [Planctomycetes bacterium]|nr:hypothetical protein [Planctomycetota bacterium]